jgi:hypothetical protein
MTVLVKQPFRLDCPAFARHLLALGGADRRLRFGAITCMRSAAFEQRVALVDYEMKSRRPRFLAGPTLDSSIRGTLANSQATCP